MSSRTTNPCRLLVMVASTVPLSSALADPATYEIDPAHVVVGFRVDHLGFADVVGFFGDVEGSYIFDETTGELSNVMVTVATNSVFSNHEDRDDHLRGSDFLDARRHEEMRFSSTAVERVSESEFVVTGQLELLGMSRPLVIEATLNNIGEYPIGRNAYAMGVSATAMLQRSEFGMSYGVDNGWVGDTVEIFIEFEAQRQ